jgi:hypothetical protein
VVGTATCRMKRPQAVAGAAIRPKKSWKSKKPAMGAANDTKKIHSKQAVGTAMPKDLLRVASLGQRSIHMQFEHLDRARAGGIDKLNSITGAVVARSSSSRALCLCKSGRICRC